MKHLYTLCIFLVLSMQQTFAQTYTFNWATGILFNLVGGLLTGNVNNVNSSSVNTTVNLSSNQSDAFTTYSSFTSPTVSGSPFTTDFFSALPNLAVGINFTDKAKYTDIAIQFSSTVKNVKFNIADIDKSFSGSSTWDKVIITGYNGATAVSNPAISKVWWLNSSISISGNTVTASGGTSSSSWIDQDGSVEVDFGSTMLTSINVRLQATAASQADPVEQAIGIGNISFQRAIVLPLTLKSFNGAVNNNSVKLNWESAQEQNLNKYIVEKSTDGVNWQTLTTVMATGSNNANEYNSVDNNAAQVNYYRLKQVETNGSFTYSQVIRIRKEENDKLALKIYPNPVISNATININSENKLAAHIKIYNQFGMQLQYMQRSLIAGSNNIPVQGLSALPAGTYIIVVEDDKLNRIGTSQFVKQ
jgi:hypothetical protein